MNETSHITYDQILRLVWVEFLRIRRQNCEDCKKEGTIFFLPFDNYNHSCVLANTEHLPDFQQAIFNLEEPYRSQAKEVEDKLINDFFRVAAPWHFDNEDSDYRYIYIN